MEKEITEADGPLTSDVEKDDRPWWKKQLLLLISGVLIGGLVASYFIFPDFKSGIDTAWDVLTSGDKERIREWVKQFGIFGPIALILGMILQIFLLFIPNLLLFIIAIICYGPVWGPLIGLVGVAASSSVGYFIGSKIGPRAIDRFVSQKTQHKLGFFVKRYGVKAIFIFRLSSLGTDALGFIAGILEMGYKKFITATLLGTTPVLVLIAIYGQHGQIQRALWWIAPIGVAALIGYMIFDRKKSREALDEINRKS